MLFEKTSGGCFKKADREIETEGCFIRYDD